MASMQLQSGVPPDVNAMIVHWGALPKFLIEGEVFYDTKELFTKHNLGRDVARYCENGDWHKSKKRFYLNARGIIALGFGKRCPHVLAYVFSLLNVSPKRVAEAPPQRQVQPLPTQASASPAFNSLPFQSHPGAFPSTFVSSLPTLAAWNASGGEFGLAEEAPLDGGVEQASPDEFSSPLEGTSSFEEGEDGFAAISSSTAPTSSSMAAALFMPPSLSPSSFMPLYAAQQYYFPVGSKRPIDSLAQSDQPPVKFQRLY